MTRVQETWEQSYIKRPYLAHISDEELADRLNYLIQNYTTLTPAQQIGLQANKEDSIHWMELLTHVFMEYGSRGGIPAGIANPDMLPQMLKAAVSEPKRASIFNKYLAKFSQKPFLEQMLNSGRIRLAPASSFQGASMNNAQRDDELYVSAFGLQSECKITLMDSKTGRSKPIEPIGNLTYKKTINTDYYVYCLTRSYERRLYGDFKANACLIIHDVLTFKERLLNAAGKELVEWTDWDQPVVYIDPYNPKDFNDLFVAFAKHHRYWYQKEYRFAWVPPNDVPKLDERYVEIGSMKDIAELVIQEE